MSEFQNRIKVNQEDLIPIEADKRCEWVMRITAKTINFGRKMEDKGKEDSNECVQYNWVINKKLGDLEYRFRKNEIGKEELKRGCEEIYEEYDLNFDVLKQNLEELVKVDSRNEKLDELARQAFAKSSTAKEEMAKLQETGKQSDEVLWNKLSKQVEEYKARKQKKQQQEKEEEKGEELS